jgi:hypothetical protein
MGILDRMCEAIKKLKRVGSVHYTNQSCNKTNTNSDNVAHLGRNPTESEKAEQENCKSISQFAHSAFPADEDTSKGSIALDEIGGRVIESAAALNADDSNKKDHVISKLSDITTNHNAAASACLRSQYTSIGLDTFELQYMEETG